VRLRNDFYKIQSSTTDNHLDNHAAEFSSVVGICDHGL